MVLLPFIFYLSFELSFQGRIYPGVKINQVSFGGQTPEQVNTYFSGQNGNFENLQFTFVGEDKIATISGKKLGISFDSRLLAEQAYLVGRSGNVASAIYQKLTTTNLPPAYKFDGAVLDNFLEHLSLGIDVPAQEALFQFENGRVIAFRPSTTGQKVDRERVKKDFLKYLSPPSSATVNLTVIPVEPKVKTEEANDLGIKEIIGEGKSFFRGSSSARIFNISLAASKLNGQLIGPGEIFSFNQAVGEVSSATGYQQAYIIREKKTVLDDGGGICQVSTTLFRTALNTGLPIEQRQAHAYRVSYYEQGGFGPGFDATVYAPKTDFKIKNDTSSYILVQTEIDKSKNMLVIDFYGTSDGRQVVLSKSRVSDETPPPPDLYQDDPNLPKDQVKQVDFAAWGAKVSFDYKVTRNDKVLQDRVFNSNFQPWQAIFLKGTKE